MPSLTQVFGAARMAVGAVSWIAPGSAPRIFGFDPRRSEPVVTQLFGARDFALGFLTATSSERTLEQVLRVGVALDAADTVASLRQIRARALSTQAILLVACGAALFAGVGTAALALERETA